MKMGYVDTTKQVLRMYVCLYVRIYVGMHVCTYACMAGNSKTGLIKQCTLLGVDYRI